MYILKFILTFKMEIWNYQVVLKLGVQEPYFWTLCSKNYSILVYATGRCTRSTRTLFLDSVF